METSLPVKLRVNGLSDERLEPAVHPREGVGDLLGDQLGQVQAARKRECDATAGQALRVHAEPPG